MNKVKNIKTYKKACMGLKLNKRHYHEVCVLGSGVVYNKYFLSNHKQDIERELEKNKREGSLLSLYNGDVLYIFNDYSFKDNANSFINTLSIQNGDYKAYAISDSFIDKLRVAYLFEVTMKKEEGRKRVRN